MAKTDFVIYFLQQKARFLSTLEQEDTTFWGMLDHVITDLECAKQINPFRLPWIDSNNTWGNNPLHVVPLWYLCATSDKCIQTKFIPSYRTSKNAVWRICFRNTSNFLIFFFLTRQPVIIWPTATPLWSQSLPGPKLTKHWVHQISSQCSWSWWGTFTEIDYGHWEEPDNTMHQLCADDWQPMQAHFHIHHSGSSTQPELYLTVCSCDLWSANIALIYSLLLTKLGKENRWVVSDEQIAWSSLGMHCRRL